MSNDSRHNFGGIKLSLRPVAATIRKRNLIHFYLVYFGILVFIFVFGKRKHKSRNWDENAFRRNRMHMSIALPIIVQKVVCHTLNGLSHCSTVQETTAINIRN